MARLGSPWRGAGAGRPGPRRRSGWVTCPTISGRWISSGCAVSRRAAVGLAGAGVSFLRRRSLGYHRRRRRGDLGRDDRGRAGAARPAGWPRRRRQPNRCRSRWIRSQPLEPAERHLQAVERVREYLRAGDVYQVNLARRLRPACRADGSARAGAVHPAGRAVARAARAVAGRRRRGPRPDRQLARTVPAPSRPTARSSPNRSRAPARGARAPTDQASPGT